MSEPVYRPSQFRVLIVGVFLLAIIAAIIAAVFALLVYVVWPIVSQNARDERARGGPVELPRPGANEGGLPIFRKDLPIPPAIFAPPGDQRIDVKLPATANRVVMAGTGRWCVLHFPRLKTVGIFDVSLAKFVRYLPAPYFDTSLAANATDVILYVPDQGTFERWNIETGVREAVFEKDFGFEIDQMFMGSASAGPLVILKKKPGAKAIEIVDPITFEPVPLGIEGARFTQVATPAFIAVSPDGRTITKTESRAKPMFEVSRLFFSNDDEPELLSRLIPSRYLMPSFDAEHLYGDTVYDIDLKPKIRERVAFAEPFLLASEHDRYFVGVLPRFRDLATIAIHDQDSTQLLTTVPDVEVGLLQDTPLSAPHRIHLIPRANRLLVVTPEKDRLSLYPLVLDTLRIQKQLDPFVFKVVNVPAAIPGKLWSPAMAGDVSIEILRGPEEMEVTDDGEIEWQVPRNQMPGAIELLLRVENEDGLERLIGIRLMVQGTGLPEREPIPVMPRVTE